MTYAENRKALTEHVISVLKNSPFPVSRIYETEAPEDPFSVDYLVCFDKEKPVDILEPEWLAIAHEAEHPPFGELIGEILLSDDGASRKEVYTAV